MAKAKNEAGQAAGDKKQIGLTSAGGDALQELIDAKLFATETDAYRFGISYALAKGLDPQDSPEGGYTTKFNAAGGVEQYGDVKSLISILRHEDQAHPYSTAERLAELGITNLAQRLRSHETMASILEEFEPDKSETAQDDIEIVAVSSE